MLTTAKFDDLPNSANCLYAKKGYPTAVTDRKITFSIYAQPITGILWMFTSGNLVYQHYRSLAVTCSYLAYLISFFWEIRSDTVSELPSPSAGQLQPPMPSKGSEAFLFQRQRDLLLHCQRPHSPVQVHPDGQQL